MWYTEFTDYTDEHGINLKKSVRSYDVSALSAYKK